MKVFTIANQKGGIGKTTTVITLANILIQRGYKVLVIDTDMQCNSTRAYNAKTYTKNPIVLKQHPKINENIITLWNVFFDEPEVLLKDAIQSTPMGDIVAGDSRFNRADIAFANSYAPEYTLAEKLEQLGDIYDYVIIDTGPFLNTTLENALIAADEVIIPISPGMFEIEGFDLLEQTIMLIKQRKNPNLKIAGLLITCYTKTTLSQEICDIVKKEAERLGVKYFPHIRRCIKISESQAKRTGIMQYSPRCNAAKDYNLLVDQLLSEEQEQTTKLLNDLANDMLGE